MAVATGRRRRSPTSPATTTGRPTAPARSVSGATTSTCRRCTARSMSRGRTRATWFRAFILGIQQPPTASTFSSATPRPSIRALLRKLSIITSTQLGRRQSLGERVGREVDILESWTNRDRRDHMQPAGARGLHERDQLQLLEQGFQCEGSLANQAEVLVGGIEVEHDLIGLVGRLDA